MSFWRIRAVGSFPPDFRPALENSPGLNKILGYFITEKAAKHLQAEWRLYRFCVRENGARELQACERDFEHRTRRVWEPTSERYVIYLDSRPREEESEIATTLSRI